MDFDDIVAELRKITTNVDNLKPEIENNLMTQLNNMGVKDLTILLGGLDKCDLQICKTIKELKSVTDLSTCELDICKQVNELNTLASTGDLSNCNLEICKRVKSLDAISNLETCDLEICKKIKELSSLTGIKNEINDMIKEFFNMLMDPLKKKLMVALGVLYSLVAGILVFVVLSLFGIL